MVSYEDSSTWQAPHRSCPWLFIRDVPHQESRQADQDPYRGVRYADVRFIHSHRENWRYRPIKIIKIKGVLKPQLLY